LPLDNLREADAGLDPDRLPDLATRTPVILFKLGTWTPDDDDVLPRPGYGFRPDMSSQELYHSVRAWWVIDPNRASRYAYAVAVAVAGGVTRGAWVINQATWRSIDGRKYGRAARRWAFEGSPVTAAVAHELVHRRIAIERPDGGNVFGRGGVIAYWPR
jgi:hypothetical protein